MNTRLLSRLAASAIFIFTLNACDGGTSPSAGEVLDRVAQFETGFSTATIYDDVNAQITGNTVVVTGMQQFGADWQDDESEYFTISALNGETEIHTLPSPTRNIELEKLDSDEILMFGQTQMHLLEKGTGRIQSSYLIRSDAQGNRRDFSHKFFVDIPGPDTLFFDIHRESNGTIETKTVRPHYFNVYTGESRISNASLSLDSEKYHFLKLISLPDDRVMVLHRADTESTQMDIFDPATDQYIEATDPIGMDSTITGTPKVDPVNNTVCLKSYHQYDVASDAWSIGGCHAHFLTNDGITLSHPDHDSINTLFPGELTFVTIEHDGNQNVQAAGTYAGKTETGQIAVVTSGIEDPIRNDDCKCYPIISAGHLVILQ